MATRPAPGTPSAPPPKLPLPPPHRVYKRGRWAPWGKAKQGRPEIVIRSFAEPSASQGKSPPRSARLHPLHLESPASRSPRTQVAREHALRSDGRRSPGAVRRHRRAAERPGSPRVARAAALRVLGGDERAGARAAAARPRAARTRGAHPRAAERAGAAPGRVRGGVPGIRGDRRDSERPREPNRQRRDGSRDPAQPAGRFGRRVCVCVCVWWLCECPLGRVWTGREKHIRGSLDTPLRPQRMFKWKHGLEVGDNARSSTRFVPFHRHSSSFRIAGSNNCS